MKLRLAVILVLAQFGHFYVAQAASKQHWVATWATAQSLVRAPAPAARPNGQPPAEQQPAAPEQLIATRGFSNQTVRMVVRASIGGRRLRVKLSNAFGSEPVRVGAARIALRAKDSGIVLASDRALLFDGKPGCVIQPGVVLLSDPVDLDVPRSGELAVSLYFPEETGPPTAHAVGLHSTYISRRGNVTAQSVVADPIITQSYYYLAAIDVLAPASSYAIVAFGDSITDGARSTPETDHSWPALLGARLAADKRTANLAVVNVGISGNRLMRDGSGASALARFDRDALSQSGVKVLMLLEGINDIGRQANIPADTATAEDLIAIYRQIIEEAHAHEIMVVGCTLTPFEGAAYYRENLEPTRAALNTFIRTSGEFDAVVDFEAATRDPNTAKRIRAEFDPGDHLHPNDAGYQAMANAVDLSIFTGKTAEAFVKR